MAPEPVHQEAIQAKAEAVDWAHEMIESLQEQCERIEGELDLSGIDPLDAFGDIGAAASDSAGLGSGRGGGRRRGAAAAAAAASLRSPRLALMCGLFRQHRAYCLRMEQVLRLAENEEVSPGEILETLRDTVEVYVVDTEAILTAGEEEGSEHFCPER